MEIYVSHINRNFLEEILSKMMSNIRWPLERVPTVGGFTIAKAEPPMQPLLSKSEKLTLNADIERMSRALLMQFHSFYSKLSTLAGIC